MQCNTELELTNSVNEFNRMIEKFILNKKISEIEVKNIKNISKIVADYKKYFSNSNKKPIEIVKIFTGLNLLENFLILSEKRLLEGIEKKENPKSAEEIYLFGEDLKILSNNIDAFKLNSKRDLPNIINFHSIELRERLRDSRLYPTIEEIEKMKDKNSKELQKQFIKQVDQIISV